jgi:hypothetical protein
MQSTELVDIALVGVLCVAVLLAVAIVYVGKTAAAASDRVVKVNALLSKDLDRALDRLFMDSEQQLERQKIAALADAAAAGLAAGTMPRRATGMVPAAGEPPADVTARWRGDEGDALG